VSINEGLTRLKASRMSLAAVTRWRPALRNSAPAPTGAMHWEVPMLHYAVVFFVIAIIAAILGFSGIAGAATNIAWLLFLVFLVLAIISLLRGRRV